MTAATVPAPKVKKGADHAADGAERNAVLESVRKALLAGIGAVALAQDEAESLVNKLVERGQIAEKDGRKLIGELMEKRKKSTKMAEQELDKRLEELLGRMNVPTKADLDALSAKITTLTKKVDELKKAS
jgi:poly(hydroxyalkanoate) granule-associated protein